MFVLIENLFLTITVIVFTIEEECFHFFFMKKLFFTLPFEMYVNLTVYVWMCLDAHQSFHGHQFYQYQSMSNLPMEI
jgi:hypothetical protein